MTSFNFYNSFYRLLLVVLIISSCNGQVTKNNPPGVAPNAKPAPLVIGSPPFSIPRPANNEPGLVSQYIRSIFQDSKGNYWFGPLGHGAIRYDGTTLKYFTDIEFYCGNDSTQHEYGSSVHAITEDKNGNIWFGTDHGAIKYDGKTFRCYTDKSGLSNIRVGRKSILADKTGTIWVGTEGGVFRYNPSADSAGGRCFSLFHLLAPFNIKDIMEDKAGNIWFATQDNGVFYYDGKTIKNIKEKEGLGDNYAGGMIQDQAGNFYFTMKGGICRYDGKKFTDITTNDGIGGSDIWGICLEKPGIIWITARGSTTRYDTSLPVSNSKAFTVFRVEDGINCCVQSMYLDRLGNMWWGTGEGLYRFDGNHFYKVKQNGPW